MNGEFKNKFEQYLIEIDFFKNIQHIEDYGDLFSHVAKEKYLSKVFSGYILKNKIEFTPEVCNYLLTFSQQYLTRWV